jgi:nitrite reductase/ring-hydroxylating ferredoxin subunit
VKAADRDDDTTRNAMKRYVKVARKGDIEPRTDKTVDVNGTQVALFNVDDIHHAIHNTCLHEDGSLGENKLSNAIVACPLHAYEFDVTSGQCLNEPAYSVERFEVRVEGDDILIGVEAVVPDASGAAARAALPEEAR